MKEYEAPELIEVQVEIEDIIASSGLKSWLGDEESDYGWK